MIGDKLVTGNVYFVDSGATGASDSNDGLRPDKGRALATLDGANNKCTANNGDFIIVMPGHAETTSAIAMDTAGVTVIGVGHGADRPTITASTATSDLIDLSAASIWIENLKLIGAASGVTALVDFATGADDCTLKNISFENAAAPLDTVTIAATADRGTIEGCTFLASAVNVDTDILFETGTSATAGQVCKNWTIKDNLFNHIDSAGCDEGCIVVSMSSGGVTGILIQDCNFLGLANGEAAINSAGISSGRAEGLVVRCNVHTAHNIDAFIVSGKLGYIECHAVEPADHSCASMLSTYRTPQLTPKTS
jgi:hypothetical protein